MAITEMPNGNLRFDYELCLHPCCKCGCSTITLYENGGKTAREHRKGTTSGGGICTQCNHTVLVDKIPPVPSMTMLLEIWNTHNPIKRKVHIPWIEIDPKIDQEIEEYFSTSLSKGTKVHVVDKK